MNRSEFEELELQIQQSDLPLKLYLQQVGVSYSTYHYWRKNVLQKRQPLCFRRALKSPFMGYVSLTFDL